MLSNAKSRRALAVLGVLWFANAFVAQSQTPQQSARQKDSNPISQPGKQNFASTCAGCHGLDGRGGERAPNIADNPKVQRLSDAQIARIVENGIPGAGMPAFRSLTSSDVKTLVAYLHTLQGANKTVKLPSDPKRGKTIFFTKAGCSNCHMVAGKGGFIASDLSSYARTHAVEEARSAISNPTPGSDRQVRMVTVTTRTGEKYIGIVRNEDNFSVQLQTLDGTFHFLSKSDIETLAYNSQTVIHTDYASTLGPSELNDVVSYLMSVANASGPETPSKAGDEE
jgi:cytochrome c oxidase cbb3-type subunit 3